jgi:hypothetical protein
MKKTILLATVLALAGCEKKTEPAAADAGGPAATTKTTADTPKPAEPKKEEPKEAPKSAGAGESPEALEKQITALRDAVKTGDSKQVEGPLLDMGMVPDKAEAWFKSTFGDEKGAVLFKEWEEEIFKNLPKMVRPFKEANKDGKTEIKVIKIEKGSKEGTGLQTAALEAMKKPQPLYTVKLLKPGETAGLSLWSFAFIDGKFRMLGKMSKVK